MDLMNLVDFVIAWEEGEERDHFKEHASHPPQIHLVPVVSVRQQALGGSVPTRGDVLCVRLLGVDAAARPEVGELDVVLHEQDVLGLDVAVEDAVAVHVVDGLQQLVHVVLHAVLGQVVALALDGVVHVHVHQLKDESESASGLITIIYKYTIRNIINTRIINIHK